MSKTLNISSPNIPTIIREEVREVMREILSDSDAGLELTADFNRRLKKSVRQKKEGRVAPLSDIFGQYGV